MLHSPTRTAVWKKLLRWRLAVARWLGAAYIFPSAPQCCHSRCCHPGWPPPRQLGLRLGPESPHCRGLWVGAQLWALPAARTHRLVGGSCLADKPTVWLGGDDWGRRGVAVYGALLPRVSSGCPGPIVGNPQGLRAPLGGNLWGRELLTQLGGPAGAPTSTAPTHPPTSRVGWAGRSTHQYRTSSTTLPSGPRPAEACHRWGQMTMDTTHFSSGSGKHTSARGRWWSPCCDESSRAVGGCMRGRGWQWATGLATWATSIGTPHPLACRWHGCSALACVCGTSRRCSSWGAGCSAGGRGWRRGGAVGHCHPLHYGVPTGARAVGHGSAAAGAQNAQNCRLDGEGANVL